jgi:hypothetical protein
VTEHFFGLVKLPATTFVPFCRRCGAIVTPDDGTGGDGLTQHRRWHASVDSAATLALPGDRP